MQCHEAEILLIDYVDGQLHPADSEALQKHLQTCEACKQYLEEYKILFSAIKDNKFEKPGPALREKFSIMLQSELNIDQTTRILQKDMEVIALKKPSLLFRIAASIILIAGGILIGTQITPGSATASSVQMADLKNEVKEMKEVLMFNMLGDESASERIKAVNYAEEMSNPDQKIITALITTMNKDKNVNVRLAALYSVAKFSNSPIVRDSLVSSLRKQTEPIMQIVLINILTEKKETKAIGPIREILSNKKTLKTVKDVAQKGLNLL